jgi:hypothetical protein
MNRPIVVDAGQEIACPKCSHAFHLSEGISRQTIDGLAEQFEHSQNELRKEMEEGLAIEARRKAERDAASEVSREERHDKNLEEARGAARSNVQRRAVGRRGTAGPRAQRLAAAGSDCRPAGGDPGCRRLPGESRMIDDPLGLPDDGPDPPLSFAWESLPRLDCKPGGYRSISETAVWTTGLRDGQSIHLSSLSQHLTYGGVLAGLPLDDATRSWPLRNAIEGAAAQFGIEPYRVQVGQPAGSLGTFVSQIDRERNNISIDNICRQSNVAGGLGASTPA